MSLVSAMNVEQNKGWICGLRFGLGLGHGNAEKENNLMEGKPHLTLEKLKFLNARS